MVVLAVVAVLVHRQAFAKETTEYHDRAGGTQVSGQISELLVDFNDTVKKGQLLARTAPALAGDML